MLSLLNPLWEFVWLYNIGPHTVTYSDHITIRLQKKQIWYEAVGEDVAKTYARSTFDMADNLKNIKPFQ